MIILKMQCFNDGVSYFEIERVPGHSEPTNQNKIHVIYKILVAARLFKMFNSNEFFF